MAHDRLRRRLHKLHAKNPRCHWCQEITVIGTGKRQKANFATIDHLNSRSDFGKRLSPKIHPKEERTVLSCYKCNNERGKIEYSKLSIYEQKIRSGSGGILEHMDVSASIYQNLLIMEEDAIRHRASCLGYVRKLLSCLHPDFSEDFTKAIIIALINANNANPMMNSRYNEDVKYDLRNENKFLLQFLPKVNDYDKIKKIIIESNIVKSGIDIGQNMKAAMAVFKKMFLFADGNVVKQVVLGITEA